jgi:hypothetical protein
LSEIGSLIVSLKAETAQFTSDLGKVKSDLDDLKDKSGEAGQGISASMHEATGGLMLVEDSVGVRLPRHLNSLIATIPGVGQAFAMMLPIAGVVVAIKIIADLIEKHEKAAEAARELGFAEQESGIKGQQALNSLDDKLLTVQKRTDELAGDHLGALKRELELIDHQSLNELINEFDRFGHTAEKIINDIQASIGKMDIFESGVKGVKSAYQEFTAAYEGYLTTATKANGNEAKAEALRQNTLRSAQAVLTAQKEIVAITSDQIQVQDSLNTVKKDMAIIDAAGIGASEKDIAAQQAWVNVLNLTGQAKEKIAAISKGEGGNARTSAAIAGMTDEANLQKTLAAGVEQHSQALIKLARTQAESTMAATKGGEDDNIDAKLAKQKAAISAEKQDSIDAADTTLKAKQAVFNAELKAASNNATKIKELDAQWANDVRANADAVIQITANADKQTVEADRSAALQRAAIAKALQQATADDAMKAAISSAERLKKIAEQAAKDDAALHRRTEAQTLQAEVAANNAEVQAEVHAYQTRLKNLDKFDKDYEKQVKQLNDKIVETTRKGQDQETSIIAAAAQKQAMEIKASEDKMKEAIAGDIANSIVMNKSLAASFRQTGEQMAEQMIKNLIMMELTGDKEKLIHAKNAYGKAFDAMSGIPPAPAWGYVAGAAAFAAVMSFEEGGKIPGSAVGSAGAVPIIGHQGETIITKSLTDRVERAERGGNNGAAPNISFSPTIHAVDAKGVDEMLSKHASIFQRHITAAMRRSNR